MISEKRLMSFLLIFIFALQLYVPKITFASENEYVYIKNDFSNMAYSSVAAKGNTIKLDNESVLFERASGNTSDFHFDINNFHYEKNNLVYEFDLYLENTISDFTFCFKDEAGNFFNAIKLQGTNLYAAADSNIKTTVSVGKWHTVSVAIDKSGQKYSMYVDGNLISYKNFFAFTVSTANISNITDKPAITRFHIAADENSQVDMFRIDNYHVYSGSSYRDVSGEDISIVINESVSSWSDDGETTVYERPDRNTILSEYKHSALNGIHPRLLASAEDFENIKALSSTDPQMIKWRNSLIWQADRYLMSDPLQYELRDGVRLWYVSMDFIERISNLAMAYRLTGDTKYSDKALVEMKSVASFDYWHPEHHMDVGGLSVGFAIGYDWLYDTFTDEDKEFLEKSVYEKAFYDYNLLYQTESNSMGGALYGNNHNAVMNAGAVMLGAAFTDVYPELSSYFISSALRCNEVMLENIGDEGSWYEGLSYAAMTVEYETYLLAVIDKIFSTTYSLDQTPGLSKLPEYFIYLQTSSGQFSFSDNILVQTMYDAGILWLMNYYDNNSAYSGFESLFSNYSDANCTVRNLLWYEPQRLGNDELPLDKYYYDDAIITSRESFSDEDATFIGMKGGSPLADHAHMDMGTFAYFDNGVEWTKDLGAGNYNAPGYWDTASLRWQYYPLRAESHNCLVINPDENPEYSVSGAKAEFTEYISDERMIAVLDMTSIQKDVSDAKRGFYCTDNRKSLVIRDEITLSASESDVYWFMQTAQSAEIDGENNRIILTAQNDNTKKLYIDFCASGDFELSVAKSAPLETSPNPAYNADYDGVTRIMLKMDSCSGDVNITVKLTPSYVEATDVSQYDVPISNWNDMNIRIPEDNNADSVKGEFLYSTDFENNAFRTSGSYRYLTLNGVDECVKDGGKIELRSYASCSTEDISATVKNGDGKSLTLSSTASSQVRVESGAKSDGILVFEFDYGKSTDEISTNAIEGYFTNHNGNTNQPAGNVCFDVNGRIIVFGEDVSGYSANTMYHIKYAINFEEQNVEVYINNIFSGSTAMVHGGCREWYRSSLAVTYGTVEQYVDNFDVYQYGHKNMIVDANAIYEDKTLILSPAVITDGTVTDALIIVALYNQSGELADTAFQKHTFSETLTKYQTDKFEFAVSDGYSYKVFFWNGDFITPLAEDICG